jgi:branched-chain amino acid transport system ATP-binding protein
MKVVLRIDDLFKTFADNHVLSGVRIDVLEGERHVIIGPNGAGKTTLFNIITGLYKPSRGRIYFLDKDITKLPPHKTARLGLSRSFQIINIFPRMSVYENVRNAIVSKHNKRFNCMTLLARNKTIMRETEQVVDLFELKNVKDVMAADLSYGTQRHLELSLALAFDPVLVMLDEPTAGLNSEESSSTVELIRQVTGGKTLVMIEHDMNVVFNLADRITVLSNGRVLATGVPSEVRENEQVKRVYLGRK